MKELRAKDLREQLDKELLAYSLGQMKLIKDESEEDRLLEFLGDLHNYGHFETTNFLMHQAKMFHTDGEDSESFKQHLVFKHKPTGKFLVLEAWHNSYEYMEYTKEFLGKEVEVKVKRWVKE